MLIVSRYFEEREKQIIIQMYQQGYNTVSISKATGRSQSGIERFLRRKNLYDGMRKLEISSDEIINIADRYKNGETAKEILVDFYPKIRSENTIVKLATQYGQSPRRAVRRSTVKKHDYFQEINTPEKAYWLGLLIADGSVVRQDRRNRSPVVALELQAKDKYLLEMFRDAIEGSFALTPSRGCFRINFSSKKMVQDLARFGVVPNKSYLNNGLPSLSSELMPHLIRGIFDGNGTVYISKNRLCFGFYGSNQMCEDIKTHLVKHCGLNKSKVFDKGTVSMVYFSAAKDVQSFYWYIYTHPCPHMIRKKQKFDCYLANTEITVLTKAKTVS